MLTRDLLIDAAVACTNAGFGNRELMQRRVRCGYVTATQLLAALQTIGIIGDPEPGPGQPTRCPSRRARADRDAFAAEIDAAITNGIVTCDDIPQRKDSTCSPTN